MRILTSKMDIYDMGIVPNGSSRGWDLKWGSDINEAMLTD